MDHSPFSATVLHNFFRRLLVGQASLARYAFYSWTGLKGLKIPSLRKLNYFLGKRSKTISKFGILGEKLKLGQNYAKVISFNAERVFEL